MVDLPNPPASSNLRPTSQEKTKTAQLSRSISRSVTKGCFSESMMHKGFMVYRKGIHAKGVFVTFVVVGVVAVFESGIVEIKVASI